MFFMPAKKELNPVLNLRYTLQKPLIRNDLPKDLLDKATHVDFDAVKEGKVYFRVKAKIFFFVLAIELQIASIT